MSRRHAWKIAATLAVAALLITACGGSVPTSPPATSPSEAPLSPTTAPTATVESEPETPLPTELKIAVVMTSTVDQPWWKTLLQGLDRLAASKPHGLTITYDYTEGGWGDEAERTIRAYADTGEYGMILPASALSDQVKNVMDEYPDTLFTFTSSGNKPLGKNGYYTYHHLHEAGYLLGLMAGSLTETNTIGIVGAYPFEEPNDVLNGFAIGAKEANPNVKIKITYIESWFDPPKAKEAAYALLAAGADYIFAERYGPFEALAEKGKFGFGQYEDQSYLAPEVVVSSTVMYWDPILNYLLEEWWQHVTAGKPYDAPMEAVWFSMAQGGSDIAPYHYFEDKIPQEVKDLVAQKREAIVSGEFVVPLITEPVPSD